MFTKTHPTWRLAAASLRSLIAATYREHPAKIALGVTDLGMATQVRYNPADRRLVLGPDLFNDVDNPAPLGQPTELHYQLQQPRVFGAIAATFAPYQHSPWRQIVADGEAPDPEDYQAALLLDQIRAEVKEVERRPVSRLMMQAYLGSTLPPTLAPATAREAVEAVMGVLVRISTGVISGGDTAGLGRMLRRQIDSLAGEDIAGRLHALITRVLEADGTNPAEMLGLGHRWNELLAELPEVDDDALDMVDIQLWRGSEIITEAATKEVSLLQLKYPAPIRPPARRLAPETPQEWAAALAEEAEEGGDGEDGAEGDENAPLDDDLTSMIAIPQSRWISYREPTDAERRELIEMSRQLQELRYRQPRITHVPSQIPRGRLNTRQLVQHTAQRTNGTMITATPWQRETHMATDQPGLTCALVLDTSLSMGLFRNELLSLNWKLAQATTAVGGTISTWGFGGDAFEIIRAGTQPRLVPTVADTGSTSQGSALALANAAADANLHMTSGTRVAVVVTDAALGAQELSDLDDVFGSLRRDGVHTLLLRVGSQAKGASTQEADIVDCRWGSDLAPTLIDHIVTVYAGA